MVAAGEGARVEGLAGKVARLEAQAVVAVRLDLVARVETPTMVRKLISKPRLRARTVWAAKTMRTARRVNTPEATRIPGDCWRITRRKERVLSPRDCRGEV